MLARANSCLALIAAMSATAFAADHPLVVDPDHSRVEVAVKATAHSFTGRLGRFQTQIALGDDGRITSARVDFHFRDVTTGRDARDRAMHQWQQTETYPDGTFVLTSLESAEGGTLSAKGRLTFHGTTREIRFPVTVSRDGPAYGIDGDAAIDTREYGLPIIRIIGVLKVDPIVHVRFHLQGSVRPGM